MDPDTRLALTKLHDTLRDYARINKDAAGLDDSVTVSWRKDTPPWLHGRGSGYEASASLLQQLLDNDTN